MRAFVAGFAAWSPSEASPEPPVAIVDPRLARRTSLLTRMVAHVVAEAGKQADLANVPMVFASAYGETDTMAALMGMLHADGILSPTRFHNSVTNTALGYLSISLKNKAFATAVQAGPDTVAMALVEAFALLEERGGDVLVVCADEAPPKPFAREGLSPLAVALHLSAEPRDHAFALTALRQDASAAAPPVPASIATNPVAPGQLLVDALVAGEPRPVRVSASRGGWTVSLERAERAR